MRVQSLSILKILPWVKVHVKASFMWSIYPRKGNKTNTHTQEHFRYDTSLLVLWMQINTPNHYTLYHHYINTHWYTQELHSPLCTLSVQPHTHSIVHTWDSQAHLHTYTRTHTQASALLARLKYCLWSQAAFASCWRHKGVNWQPAWLEDVPICKQLFFTFKHRKRVSSL